MSGFSTAIDPAWATDDEVAAAIASLPGPQFVSASIIHVSDVLTNFPAGPTYRGKYVRVDDLFGNIDGVMRCGMDASGSYYFWQPTTPEFGKSMAMTGNITLDRLMSPTIVNLTGSVGLGVTRTVTINTLNGRPGEIIRVKNSLSSLLGGVNILGLGLGAGVASLLGLDKAFYIENNAGSLSLIPL